MAKKELYTPEDIPDEDHLYLRVAPALVDRGIIYPGAYINHGRGMSTNWDKYSTPENTRNMARKDRDPNTYTVVSLNAGRVRGIVASPQFVEHTPRNHNRAHTDIVGEKTLDARIQFSRIAETILEGEQ
jgi:hypothetical protein